MANAAIDDNYKPTLIGVSTADGETPVRAEINPSTARLLVDAAVGGLSPITDYDYIDVQQTSSTVETYIYKLGGSGGTTVRTIVVTYTSSAKTDIDTVAYS